MKLCAAEADCADQTKRMRAFAVLQARSDLGNENVTVLKSGESSTNRSQGARLPYCPFS